MATDILFPVGRLVGGSVYKPRTTDADGHPLLIKNGPNTGQPRVEYYVGVALPKGTEPNWQSTVWGQKIVAEAAAGFPQGQSLTPAFAWKVTDGDSLIPNKKGNKPAERTGYPGHWIVNLAGAFAPQLYCADGSRPLAENEVIKCGYYVQVFGNVKSNDSQNQPGVYLNHIYVALSGYGEEISQGPDAAALGFGGPLPAGASATPVGQVAPVGQVGQVTPPPPAQHTMLPAANGLSYEQYQAAGWTDAQLVASGMMSV